MRGGVSLRRALVLVVTVVTLAAMAPANAADAICPGFRDVPHQGPSCPLAGGWLVHLRDGTTVFTHGADAPSSGGSSPPSGPDVSPACVPTTEHHNLLIYAHPHNKADRSAALAAQLRAMVNSTNTHLYNEAQRFGETYRYKFACDAPGVVTLRAESLPTSTTADSFSTIVSDLRAKGYTSNLAKYWVWYDDGVGGFGGQGTIHHDDRLVVDNANNRGGDFAVTYGFLEWTIMMHENAHNLGAVQLSAPHSSGGWHCNDGLDIMCYADGPNSGYHETACPDYAQFDCGGDSYFNPKPAPGSYLATRWNLASPLNRFFDAGNPPPAIVSFACAPSPSSVVQDAVCSFRATDDGGALWYLVDWGDGSPATRVPATGTLASGAVAQATHRWTTSGSRTVTLTASDVGTPQRSDVTTLLHDVVPNGAPAPRSISCAPNPVFPGQSSTCSFTADDDSAALWYSLDWGDGSAATRVPASGTLAPGQVAQAAHTWGARGAYSFTVTATDVETPPASGAASIPIDVSCLADWRGQLAAGLQGVELDGFSSDDVAIPTLCSGVPYVSSVSGGDIDVCWLKAGARLRCDTRGVQPVGTVPAGADAARIVLRDGVLVDWFFRIG